MQWAWRLVGRQGRPQMSDDSGGFDTLVIALAIAVILGGLFVSLSIMGALAFQ